jgi:outer membrane biosynthesis protein TonB
MKYITSALVIVALFNSQATTNAIQLRAEFSDDLVKDIALEMSKDAEAGEVTAEEKPDAAPPAEKKPAAKEAEKKKDAPKEAEKKVAQKKADPAPKDTKKDDKKSAEKKPAEKKEEEDIPMDAAAIKAYSSVIADAAEDSSPAVPVIYTETMQEEPAERREVPVGVDAMGSMIQNEISSIKEASIKAAQESSD